MRVTTAFSLLLRLPGVWIRHVAFEPGRVAVTVALRRRLLVCPDCGFATRSPDDRRPVASVWRHLDLGAWRLDIRAELRRLVCPAHGVRREAVPFARAGSHFTRDFEDVVGWLATTMDKTATCRLVRIDWDTVGPIITRVMDDGLDPDRLESLFDIGVDEVSWRKRHNYITLVSDHHRRRMVWGARRSRHRHPGRLLRRARRGTIRPDRGGVDGHVGRLRQVRGQTRPRPHRDHLLRPLFMSWPSPPRPSTRSDARCGTTCVVFPTRAWRNGSEAPGGAC